MPVPSNALAICSVSMHVALAMTRLGIVARFRTEVVFVIAVEVEAVNKIK